MGSAQIARRLIGDMQAVLGKVAVDSGVPELAPLTALEAEQLRDLVPEDGAHLLVKLNAIIAGG